MLVLSRKAGERIQIGDDIAIEVRRITGNRVSIAVQAPHEMRILRGELCEAAQDFEAETASSPTVALESTEWAISTATA